ncbi:CDP-diacylglycerol--glycerol-3-phosphate 3-phosphatidyltransferase [bacterium]|nr:CDP-diacylglycerol--glycerol-3-phosphate 3-phosphatidyltransferase [bacterium]
MTTESAAKKLPNLLTFARILCVPFFVILLVDPTPAERLIATVIFIIASLTDWLDGYLARLYHVESSLGALLDPLADKILTTAALVMLAATPDPRSIPAWIVVLILSREFIISGLRSLAALNHTVVPASESAKHKTAFLMCALILLLVHDRYFILGYLVDFYRAGMLILWLALILSVYSGIDYMIRLRRVYLT